MPGTSRLPFTISGSRCCKRYRGRCRPPSISPRKRYMCSRSAHTQEELGGGLDRVEELCGPPRARSSRHPTKDPEAHVRQYAGAEHGDDDRKDERRPLPEPEMEEAHRGERSLVVRHRQVPLKDGNQGSPHHSRVVTPDRFMRSACAELVPIALHLR